MGVKQIAEILLDQPLPRMTTPEDDVFLDTPRDDERGGRLASRRGRNLARFGCRYLGLLERFSGHVVPDRQIARLARHNGQGRAKSPIAMIILQTIL